MPRRQKLDIGALNHGIVPTEPAIAPGLEDVQPSAALAALTYGSIPSDDGSSDYDLDAARTAARTARTADADAQAQGGSRSEAGSAPPMLDIIPSPHAASHQATDGTHDSLEKTKKEAAEAEETTAIPYVSRRLSGNEDADQKVCFEYFLSRKTENRSSYDVARVFGIPTELVDRWRKKYAWDREVAAIEDNQMLDDQDEQNLHDLVGLEMATITGLQGILGRHNAASAELERMKNQPKPTERHALEEWKAERARLLSETLSPTMLMNVVDNLMILKKAKIGQRKRRPSKIFFVVDPAMKEKLIKDFQSRPTAPEPDTEGA